VDALLLYALIGVNASYINVRKVCG